MVSVVLLIAELRVYKRLAQYALVIALVCGITIANGLLWCKKIVLPLV